MAVTPASIFIILFIGIPQGFLMAYALHIFTETKIEIKRCLLLSTIIICATYLSRMLPISLGVNTILVFMLEIVVFQIEYQNQLTTIFRTIIAAVASAVLVALAEVANMILLILLFGLQKAQELYSSTNSFPEIFSIVPSNIFFILFIYAGSIILKAVKKRKLINGEAGKEAGE